MPANPLAAPTSHITVWNHFMGNNKSSEGNVASSSKSKYKTAPQTKKLKVENGKKKIKKYDDPV